MFKENGNPGDYEICFQIINQCKELQEVCYNQSINRIEDNLNDNTRLFWSFVNYKIKVYLISSIIR